MSAYNRPSGRTTVSPHVLMAIARMAALGVPGVATVGRPASSRGYQRGAHMKSGVLLVTQDDQISGDMHLIIKSGVNVREVCRNVQEQVARALQEMAGMTVAGLDIHVEDIDYDGAEA